jgi:hypothetical protein
VKTGVWWGSPRETDYLEDPGVEWRIILKRSFGTGILVGEGGHGMGLSGSELGHVDGMCECGNEPSGSIKGG